MKTKLLSILSLISCMALLFSVSIGSLLWTSAAGNETPLVTIQNRDGGNKILDNQAGYWSTDNYFVFSKDLAVTDNSAAQLMATFGNFIEVNGITLTAGNQLPASGYGDCYTLQPTAWNAVYTSISKKSMFLYSNYTYGNGSGVNYAIINNQANTVVFLPGLPFADNTVLDRRITLTCATGGSWVVYDPGTPVVDTDVVSIVNRYECKTVIDNQAGWWSTDNYFKFSKEIAVTDNSAAQLMTTFGDFIEVNGLKLSAGSSLTPSGYGDCYTLQPTGWNTRFDGAKSLLLYSNYTYGNGNGINYAIHNSQNNVVKFLVGFPFKDGTKLDRTITVSCVKGSSWAVSDPGVPTADPNAGQALQVTIGTFSVDGDNRTFPILPAEYSGMYSAVKLVFSRPLMCTDEASILEKVGDLIKLNGKTLNSMRKENTDGLGNNLTVFLSADKRELVISTRWDKDGTIYLTAREPDPSNEGAYRPADPENYDSNELLVTVCKGFPYGVAGTETLNSDIAYIWEADGTKWLYNDPNAEPDLTGVSVSVTMTDANGGSGITDAISGQSWTSVTRFVFNVPLTVADTSTDALMAKFGKYVFINYQTADKFYNTNNPQTGVPHAISFQLSADRKILTVYSDVSMPGVLIVSSDHFIILSKDFPITSTKTLGRDVAFEYSKTSGSWTATDPYTDEGDDESSTTASDVSNEESSNVESNDTGSDENPVTGYAGRMVGAAGILAVLGGVSLMALRKKNHK